MLALSIAASYAAPPPDRRVAPSSSEDSKPYYQTAAAPDFKERRVIFGRPDANTPEAQFALAQKFEAEGRFRRAGRAYNALVCEWPASTNAPAAQLKFAEMLANRGNKRILDSFREYQYFLDVFAGGDEAGIKDVFEKQFALANLLFSRLDKGFWSSPDPEVVADMYKRLVSNAPDWERAPECQFNRGMAFESKRAWYDAAAAYEALASRYPRSDLRASALYRAAHCRAKLSKAYPRDERLLKNAIAALNTAYAADAAHEGAEAALEERKAFAAELSKLNFEKARFYDEIRKNPGAAVIAYKAFLAEFPRSAEAETARRRVAELENAAH